MKAKKKYNVDFDLKFSFDFDVKASNIAEARKIAFDKLLKKLKMSDFRVYTEKI